MNTTQIATELVKSFFNPSNNSSGYSKAEWIKNIIYKEEFKIKETLNIIAERRGSFEYEYWISQSKNKESLPIREITVLLKLSKKSNPPKRVFTTKTSFINYMLPADTKGLGLGKKIKILSFLNEIFSMAIKIKATKSFKTIIKAIEKGYINYNDIRLFIETAGFNFRTKYKKIELASFVLMEKHREVIICLLQGLSNQDTGKTTKLTRERVRQIGQDVLKNERFLNAVKYYELQTEFFQLKNEDTRDLFVASKDIKRKTEGLKNKRIGPPKKLFLNKVEETFYNQDHIYFDVYKNKPQKIKTSYRYLIKSFYLKKDVFFLFERKLEIFYNKLFLRDSLIEKKDFNKDFLDFIEKHRIKIFDSNTVYFSKHFIYMASKTSVPFLVELAIKKSEKPTKTLRIKEIHKWIITNFPHKKITSIEGIRGALINSKNIIAFGKTGNYGLAKDYGVKKSSDLSTKNLIIEILKKNENPVTEDVIEKYVMNKNPFLKERGVPMIIEINPKTFKKISFSDGNTGNKGIGRSYIGLVERKYPEHPKNFSSKELKEYLNSKDLRQEWLSFSYIKKKLDIPEFQLKDFLLRKNYLIHENMITLSTPNPAVNNLIIKLLNNQSLINQVGSYLDMNITEKTSFKKRAIEIIEKEYSIRLKNNHISKIINFIV